MPNATLTRGPTAHTDAELTNGAPSGDLFRRRTGHVAARITTGEVGV